MATSPDVSGAAAYGKKFAKGIILKIWSALADQGVRVETNIKGPTKFAKMAARKGLKAYNGTFTSPGGVVFTDRELTPKLATYETKIVPLDYYNTWMADQIRANATAKNIPFENYMWLEITKEIQHEIVNSMIGIGDTADTSTDLAIRITDGFLKIIDTINPTPEATGAIDADDVVDQIEAVYNSIPTRFRKYEMNVYISQSTYDMYVRRYRALFHSKPTYNKFDLPVLDVGSGKAILKPVEWLTGDEIIITPMDNLVFGTDSLSDLNTIEMVKTVYGFETAIVFPIGFQIPDTEVLFVNDMILP